MGGQAFAQDLVFKGYCVFVRLLTLLAALSMASVAVLIILFALPVFLGSHGSQVFSFVWQPDAGQYGIMPMAIASLVLSTSALLLAWPFSLGLACALCLHRGGSLLLGIIRGMTTIPTVVYGFASVFLLVPLVREAAARGSGLSWLTAMLVLALLITPTMVLVLDAALRPLLERHSHSMQALGFAQVQTLAYVALPACAPYMLAAAVLGFGRAIGDTLVPLMLSGNATQVPHSLFAGIRTLTAHMALVTATEAGGPAYNSLFAAGAILLVVSIAVSLLLRRLSQRAVDGAGGIYWGRGYAPGVLGVWSWWCHILLIVLIIVLLGFLLWHGVPVLGAELFFGDTPPLAALLGRMPVWDGIWPACAGTLSLLVLTILLALGPGIACGIYLAGYAGARGKAALGLLVDTMAGIPSIVMGLFGFTLIVFIRQHVASEAGPGLLLAAICLALLVLPSLIVATRSTLESLPDSLRITGEALGLSHTQCLRYILLPQASRGILGGIMLAMGRAAEDTAVIMLTGVVINAGLPAGLGMRFEALPFTIYYTAAQYQNPEELARGFGAALVLLALSGGMLLGAWHLQKLYKKKSEQGYNV